MGEKSSSVSVDTDGQFHRGRRSWRCTAFGHAWKNDQLLTGPEEDDWCQRCGAWWETFHGDCRSSECEVCSLRDATQDRGVQCGLDTLVIQRELDALEAFACKCDRSDSTQTRAACSAHRIADLLRRELLMSARREKLLVSLAPTIAFALSRTWGPGDFAEYKRLTLSASPREVGPAGGSTR